MKLRKAAWQKCSQAFQRLVTSPATVRPNAGSRWQSAGIPFLKGDEDEVDPNACLHTARPPA